MSSALSDEDVKPYIAEIDDPRLVPNMEKVRILMDDRRWRTLSEIADESGLRAESVSAHVRDLRKPKNGGFVVDRRPRGGRIGGLFEYRLQPPGTVSPYSGAASAPRKLRKKTGFLAGLMYAARILLKEPDLESAKRAMKLELRKAAGR